MGFFLLNFVKDRKLVELFGYGEGVGIFVFFSWGLVFLFFFFRCWIFCDVFLFCSFSFNFIGFLSIFLDRFNLAFVSIFSYFDFRKLLN